MKKQLQAICLLILSFMSFQTMAQIPTDGLLVYYPFDNNATDYSGNGYNAVTSNTTYSAVGPNADDYSIYNTSDAGQTYYNFTTQASDFKSQSYSSMMWVNLSSIPATYGNLLELGSATTTSHYFRFLKLGTTYYLQAGHYNVGPNNGNNAQYTLPNSPLSQWNMVGVTSDYNPGAGTRTIKIYMNGAEIFSQTFGSNITIAYNASYARLNIGCRDGAANMYLDGKMEDFTYYNRALTAQEVSDYYNACPFANSIKESNGTLYANTKPGLSYQWMDCANNQPIVGETAQTFTPTVVGSYKVALSYLYGTTNCADESTCESITIPNPSNATELFHFQFDGQSLVSSINAAEELVVNQGTTQFTTSTSAEGGTHALSTDGNQHFSMPFTMPATGGFTISMWVNRPTASGDYDVLATHVRKEDNGISYPGTFLTGLTPSGRPFMETYQSTTYAPSGQTNNYILPDATWQHLTFQWKQGTPSRIYIYVNGVLSDSAVGATTLNTGSMGVDFAIGALPTTTAGTPGLQSSYEGHIDEVRLFDGALTPTEITDLYNNVLNVNTVEEQKTVAVVFPNPAKTILNVLLNTQGETTIEIYDLTGKQVKTAIVYDAQTQLNIEDLNTGIYLLKITNGNETATSKFIKE